MGVWGWAISIPFRRLIWAIPAAYVLHVIEESVGGFNAWASQALGGSIDATVFALANVAFMAVVVGLTAWASLTETPGAVFLLLTWTSAHLFWDSVAHLGWTIGLRRYSPGLVTACLFYLPLSLIVVGAALRQGAIGARALAAATGLGAGVLAFILLTGHALH